MSERIRKDREDLPIGRTKCPKCEREQNYSPYHLNRGFAHVCICGHTFNPRIHAVKEKEPAFHAEHCATENPAAIKNPELAGQIKALAAGIKGLLNCLQADPGTRIAYEGLRLMDICREILGEIEKGKE